MIATIVRILTLAAHLHTYAPNIDAPHAIAHAVAAELAASPAQPAELLLAVAYVESRYDPTATSTVRGRRFCGVMQTTAGTEWATCLEQRALLVGYRTGATMLQQWQRAAGADLQRALNGYGCGFAGFDNGCHNYGARVLAVARRFGLTDRRTGI